MNCPNCNDPTQSNIKFCGKCGTALSKPGSPNSQSITNVVATEITQAGTIIKGDVTISAQVPESFLMDVLGQ